MKKYIRIAFICLIISLVLELFVFNFRFFLTFDNNKDVLDNIHFSDGVEKSKDKLILTNDDYIEIKNINKNIDNIKLDISFVSNKRYLAYDISVSDEGSKPYYQLPRRYIYPYIEKSKYISLNLSGKAKNLKIHFAVENEDSITIKINEISINNKIPLQISFTRIILSFFVIFTLYLIRPSSKLYKYKVNFNSKSQKIILSIVFAFITISFLFVINANSIIKTLDNYSNHSQYQSLAVSLSEGKTYLDKEPSKELKEMENPYDYNCRNEIIKEKGNVFEWDYAYYEGKYYVYFGIVPVITSYLPFYLLTGQPLNNFVVVFITCFLAAIGIFLLLKEIVKRYFPNTSFLLFLILYVFMAFGCGLLNILGYATLYNVPIAYALMFIFWGLYFFISSIKENKISKVRIFLGSLCMALVAGCRPQLLLTSFLVIPIFFDEVFKKRTLFSKKSIAATICFVIPYIVVAAFLMYYNYIRFGSVFDFGANYNLTGNDMTRRGFNIDRIGLGLFSYLFQPVSLTATFPFLTTTVFTTNYMGTTIRELLFGGLFSISPLLLLGVIFFKFKTMFPSKKLFYICLICIVSGFIIVITDTQMAGILARYLSDFSFLFYIPTIIVLFSIFSSKIPYKYLKIILFIVLIFIILMIIYQFLYLFDDQYLHDMLNSSTEFYFKWYYLLQWWL